MCYQIEKKEYAFKVISMEKINIFYTEKFNSELKTE